VRNFGNIKGCKDGVLSTATNTTISNNTITNMGLDGIILNSTGATGATISGNTIAGAFGYGIYSKAASASITSNTVTGQRSDISQQAGACFAFEGAGSQTVTGNTCTASLTHAFIFRGTVGGTFSSNVVTTPKSGVFWLPSGVSTSGITWNTNNTLDTYPIYLVESASSTTYDLASLGTLGAFVCRSCTSVTIKDGTVIDTVAITGNGNTVQNITLTGSNTDIWGRVLFSTTEFMGNAIVLSGNNNTVTGCTLDRVQSGENSAAITMLGTGNVVTGNTITRSQLGVSLLAAGTITGNTFAFNRSNLFAAAGSTVTGNTSDYELDLIATRAITDPMAKMVTWVESRPSSVSIGGTASFSFSLADGAGVSCSSCTYTVSTYPSETVTSSKVGNVVSGSFTPSRGGTYTLYVTASDGSNTWRRNFIWAVGATSTQTTRYYIRMLRNVNGGNGGGLDASVMSTTAPSVDELLYCSADTISNPLEIPNYPLSVVTGASSSLAVSVGAEDSLAAVDGFYTRFPYYDRLPPEADTPNVLAVAPVTKYTFVTGTMSLSSVAWPMDIAAIWRLPTTYISGAGFLPILSSPSATPSYTDWTATYASTYPVYSLSEDQVATISSTQEGIVLHNPTSASRTQTAVVGGFTSGQTYGAYVGGLPVLTATADGSGRVSAALPVPASTIRTAQILRPVSGLAGYAGVSQGNFAQ